MSSSKCILDIINQQIWLLSRMTNHGAIILILARVASNPSIQTSVASFSTSSCPGWALKDYPPHSPSHQIQGHVDRFVAQQNPWTLSLPNISCAPCFYSIHCSLSRDGPIPFITVETHSPCLSSVCPQQIQGIGCHSGKKNTAPIKFPTSSSSLCRDQSQASISTTSTTRGIVLRWAGGYNLTSSQNPCFDRAHEN